MSFSPVDDYDDDDLLVKPSASQREYTFSHGNLKGDETARPFKLTRLHKQAFLAITSTKRPTWCWKGGGMTRNDIEVCKAVFHACQPARRLFVTGEIELEALTEEGFMLLLAANKDIDTQDLFTGTLNGSVRMRRFQPALLWEYLRLADFAPQLHVAFAEENVAHGLDEDENVRGDYWQSIITDIGQDIFCRGDSTEAMYLNALNLFGKTGFLDLSPAEALLRVDFSNLKWDRVPPNWLGLTEEAGVTSSDIPVLSDSELKIILHLSNIA
jgi:hypothetical protein